MSMSDNACLNVFCLTAWKVVHVSCVASMDLTQGEKRFGHNVKCHMSYVMCQMSVCHLFLEGWFSPWACMGVCPSVVVCMT